MLQPEYRPISVLKKLPNNPRLIKDSQFKTLCESIERNKDYFEARPIILSNRTGELIIIAGNQRYEAARHLKIKEVPTVLMPDLTEEKEREIIIRDNISNGEWNMELLANEWQESELLEWGLELPELFNSKDAVEDDYIIPDEIQTDIVLGDLFEIGQHKLLCGDSTKAEDVSKLLDGAKPNLMVTDPPYGVNYDIEWRETFDNKGLLGNRKQRARTKVNNDDNNNWTEAYSLFNGTVCYVWHAGRHAEDVSRNLRECGFEIVCQIIWAKPQGVFSRGDYHWQHEPCYYAVRKGNKHNWQGSRKETTLWQIAGMAPFGRSHNENDKILGHSTQKPVECMARPIRNNSYERESVYDPFVGSGTTIVAGHQLNRKVYAMEVEPKYCQCTLDRIKKLDPAIEIKKNGVPYKCEIKVISG